MAASLRQYPNAGSPLLRLIILNLLDDIERVPAWKFLSTNNALRDLHRDDNGLIIYVLAS
ncbi:MAG: hypothetical protein ACYDAH_11350 [Steroidobacteraceae bacterium]